MTPEEKAINDRVAVGVRRRHEAADNEFQRRADALYHRCGFRDGRAPERQLGQNSIAYRKAIYADALQSAARLPTLGNEWLCFDPEKAHDVRSLEAIEGPLFAAIADAATASGPGAGPLRMVERRDDAGRTVRHFYGDPEDCWGQFKTGKVKSITRFATEVGNGKNSPGRKVAVAEASARKARAYALLEAAESGAPPPPARSLTSKVASFFSGNKS